MSPKADTAPSLRYTRKSTKTLHEDPENLRQRDSDAVAAIAASLQRFGQQKPIVVLESGKIIAGNGTFAAAKLLGWDEIDVAVTSLDEERARAFAIADNRTGDLSHWDKKGLLEALEEIDAEGDEADLFATGFSEADVERLRAAMLEGTGADPGVDADPFGGDEPEPETGVNTEGQDEHNPDSAEIEEGEDVTHRVIVSCRSEEEVEKVQAALASAGFESRAIEL